jgi:hypothetical protein
VGTLDGEVWVCAECRSINNARAKQCYNCRTPQELAAVDPATIEGTGHGKLREVALPAFHSPRPYAVVATTFIIAIAGMQVVYTLAATSLVIQVLGGVPPTEEQFRFLSTIGIATLGIGLLALVAWSLWLSRAVTSMPALGLGYPAATGLMAFVENFLPGFNLLRVPALIRDVVHRVEPGSHRGEALIFVAWIGLLLGFVVPRVGGFLASLSAQTEGAVLRSQLTIAAVSTGFVLVGAMVLVALIWWIEERIGRRREAQLAAIDAATAGSIEEGADSTDAATVPYATPRIAAAPAAPARWMWGDTSDSPLAVTAPPAQPAPAPVSAPVAVAEPEAFEAAEPAFVPAPPVTEPASAEPESVRAVPELVPAEPAPVEVADGGVPHLMIRVANRGMLQAEMAGEIEPVILEDLTAYGAALVNAGGTAEIVVTGSDGMASLIARRAQRIMADVGIEAPLPD